MKILLIKPPRALFPGTKLAPPGEAFPLGIMYIAAVLEKRGYQVEILDALVGDFPAWREGDTKQYSMSWEKIRTEIEQGGPDIIGITNPFSAEISNAIAVARIAKEIYRDVPVVVGGPHVSVMPTEFLKETESVDLVVIGEGEYTMLDVVEHYAGNKPINEIEGIAYRKDGEVVVNPQRAFITNLDELPFPAYHLVDMEKYLNPKRVRYRLSKFKREIPMISSRGCPFNCVFCSIHLHMGKKWRAHSKDYVVSHIEHIVNNYGVEHIHFEDDNLMLDFKRFEDILDSLSAREIKFVWDTPNGVRAENLTSDLLRKMKQTGCVDLKIGVESGDQYVLDNIIDKRLRLEKVVEVARMCQELDINLGAFYIIGFPGERKEQMERTIDFALKLHSDYETQLNVFPVVPYFGTRLYEICQREGYLTQELTPRAFAAAVGPYATPLIKTQDFTPETVTELLRKAMRIKNWRGILGCFRSPRKAVRVLSRLSREDVVYIAKHLIGR